MTRHPLRPERHEAEHRHSARVKGDRIANRPQTLRALLLWLQNGYALEAPNRLHDRDIADDGAPDHTGEAKSFIGFSQQREPNDWVAVDRRLDPDGFYATPMRAAITRVGGLERRQLLGGLAVNVLTPLDVTRSMDIPDWCAGEVMYRALQLLWASYADRPLPQRGRSEAQLDAEAAA